MYCRPQINGKGFNRWCFVVDAQRLILEITDISQVPVLNTKEADEAYLRSREKKPMYGEGWFLNPTLKAGQGDKINKITRLQDLCIKYY